VVAGDFGDVACNKARDAEVTSSRRTAECKCSRCAAISERAAFARRPSMCARRAASSTSRSFSASSRCASLPRARASCSTRSVMVALLAGRATSACVPLNSSPASSEAWKKGALPLVRRAVFAAAICSASTCARVQPSILRKGAGGKGNGGMRAGCKGDVGKGGGAVHAHETNRPTFERLTAAESA
jgi:hypothetical protein